MTKEALKKALEALEDLGMKHYESTGEVLYKETFTAIKEALANEALEKMAENARELGLDYEPAQEPVGWYDSISGGMDFTFYKPHRKPSSPSAEWIPVYSRPPQRKPLTDEEIQDLLMPVRISGDGYYLRIARAIEAAHGIKENT